MTASSHPLDDLITRLEAASEGSRELDADIFIAVTPGVADAGRVDRDRGLVGWWPKDRPYQSAREVPHYTESFDAARTLMPPNFSFEATQSAAGPPTFTRCRLWDWRRGPLMADPGNEWKSGGNRPLPLNACIAALKARRAAQ